MSRFGDQLRRLRRAAGLSQETLAARAGLSAEAVSLLERGRRSPRVTTMRLLADAMSLSEADRSALFGTVAAEETPVSPLPTFADPPLGRDALIARIAGLLAQDRVRVVTLLGPAGVGKSRLAAAFAAAKPSQFPGGVYWLPLGSLTDSASVVGAIAGAMGIRGIQHSPIPTIIERLRQQAPLVIVDNAEQHLQTCAEVGGAFLSGAPGLKVVFVSRHVIDIPGEVVVRVPPLELPPVGTAPRRLRDYASSALFLRRASIPAALDPPAADAVTRICHRLDGLPLALELAAARTNVLTVHELAAELDGEFGILRGPDPDDEARLSDAMVRWTYDLLAPQEKLIFERLAVFGLGFDRPAVSAVCGDGLDPVEVVEVLSCMVSKSLVERRDDGSLHARFRLLHLIRQFAMEQLEARPDDAAATQRRHAWHYYDVLRRASEPQRARDQAALSELDRETSNIRRAVEWATQHEPELALRMLVAMDQWLYLHGRYADGRRWALAALDAAGDAPARLRAPVLHLAGTLAFLQCDYADAAGLLRQSLRLWTELGNSAGVGRTTSRLATILREQGEYEQAERLHLGALEIAQADGDRAQAAVQLDYLCFLHWLRGDLDTADSLGRQALGQLRAVGDQPGVISALINLGAISRLSSDLDGAETMLSQSLDLSEELDFREGIAWSLNQLGVVARLRGDRARAAGLQLASLAEHEALGDRWRESSVRDELAAIAADEGDWESAARELAAADRLRAQIRVPVPAVERSGREDTVRRTREALGPAYEVAALALDLSAVGSEWRDQDQPSTASAVVRTR